MRECFWCEVSDEWVSLPAGPECGGVGHQVPRFSLATSLLWLCISTSSGSTTGGGLVQVMIVISMINDNLLLQDTIRYSVLDHSLSTSRCWRCLLQTQWWWSHDQVHKRYWNVNLLLMYCCRPVGRSGCQDLMREVVERVQPRFHVFGHVHEGWHLLWLWISKNSIII